MLELDDVTTNVKDDPSSLVQREVSLSSSETSNQHGDPVFISTSSDSNFFPDPSIPLSEGGSPEAHFNEDDTLTISPEFQDLHGLVDIVQDPNVLLFRTPVTEAGRSLDVYVKCIDGSCDCRPLLDGEPYQLKPCRFASLMFHNDGTLRDDNYWKLFSYIVDGFPVIDEEIEPYVCNNYGSVLEPSAATKMSKIVQSELDEGMVSEVYELPTCVHALGAVVKPDGNIRPITDCSRPECLSVNYHCSSLIEPFHFLSIHDVVSLLGPHEYMAVVDIKSAYRAVIMSPFHRKYMGFFWDHDGIENRMFQDNRLCFGLRTGPCNFNLISCFLSDVLRQRHGIRLVNYLDDFLCIGDTFASCQDAQNTVISLLRYVGFYISYNKLQPPSQITKYLGVIVDSIVMELRLPAEKILKLKSVLNKVKDLRSISKKKLESLTGVLSHCATIVRGGRLFCRRLYDLYKVLISKHFDLFTFL